MENIPFKTAEKYVAHLKSVLEKAQLRIYTQSYEIAELKKKLNN